MRSVLCGILVAAVVRGGAALADDVRPAAEQLRLDSEALLANFTAEVRGDARLRARAMGLWRREYAARAAELRRRFATEPDWRPAFADAAALIDDFLEASGLPRARAFPAPDGQMWVEELDPATQRRRRVLRPATRRAPVIAPGERGKAPPRKPAVKPKAPAADPLIAD